MNAGCEWVVDGFGGRPDALANGAVLRELCAVLVRELALKVVGEPQWHQFPAPASTVQQDRTGQPTASGKTNPAVQPGTEQGGHTALYLLSESHLSLHTFPESGLITLNLYCCRPRPRYDFSVLLERLLGCERTTVRELIRGEPS